MEVEACGIQPRTEPSEEDHPKVEKLQDYVWEDVEQDALIEELMSEWKFFVPSSDLARAILLLNDRLGSEYFKTEYEKSNIGGVEHSRSEEGIKDEHFRKGLQALEILIHDEGGRENSTLSEEEVIPMFQAFISERIFNHLAMLARSRYAQTGEFSLREELTVELAEKLGLGIYLHRKTPPALRDETEATLFRLAGEFQQWFIGEHRGVVFTTWGTICTSERKMLLPQLQGSKLILDPDLKQSELLQSGKVRSSNRNEEKLP